MTDNRIKQIADHYGLSIQLIQCASWESIVNTSSH